MYRYPPRPAKAPKQLLPNINPISVHIWPLWRLISQRDQSPGGRVTSTSRGGCHDPLPKSSSWMPSPGATSLLPGPVLKAATSSPPCSPRSPDWPLLPPDLCVEWGAKSLAGIRASSSSSLDKSRITLEFTNLSKTCPQIPAHVIIGMTDRS